MKHVKINGNSIPTGLSMLIHMHASVPAFKKPKNARHPQRRVRVMYGGKEHYIYVDEQLVPFIKRLWKEGYVTYHSCQGNAFNFHEQIGGHPYLQVAMPDTYDKYINLITMIRNYWKKYYVEVDFNAYMFALVFVAREHVYDDEKNLIFDPIQPEFDFE